MNYMFTLVITPEYIRDKLTPEQKEQFSNISIIGSKVECNGCLAVDCLATEDEMTELQFRQVLSSNEDGRYITAKPH